MSGQHILELRAENIQRLTVVDITCQPTGNVIISGENGAGKSSVLDAITMALCGSRGHSEMPIRKGKENAYVVLTTEDFIVTRRFNQYKTYLEVTAPNGTRYPSPQAILDRMFSRISIDPLAFAEMPPKEQTKTLLKLFPTAIDLEANADEQASLTAQRRDINREINLEKGKISAYKDVPANAPVEPVSILDLTDELDGLTQKERMYRQDEAEYNNGLARLADLMCEVTRLKTRIAELHDSIKPPQNHAAHIEAKRTEIKNAEARNTLARRAAQRNAILERGQELTKSSQMLTQQLEGLVAARENALRTAKFPVEGLWVNSDGELVLNGIPLAQSCSSEQIKVGVALAAAGNPALKVAFIKHGSLLDDASMKTVAAIAEQYGMQIWIERVNDTSSLAVRIEDGSNVGAVDASGKLKSDDAFELPEPENQPWE